MLEWRERALRAQVPAHAPKPDERFWLRGLAALLTQEEHPCVRPNDGAFDELAARDPKLAQVAVFDLSLAAIAQGGGERLDEWCAREATLPSGDEQLRSAIQKRFACWRQLFGGEPVDLLDAKHPMLQALPIESMILRALAAERAEDLEDAQRAARRSVLSARSEELVSYEVFASVVLARQRRRMRTPFFARHVLDQLAPLAPFLWRPWIAWEQRMSGCTRLGPVFDAPNEEQMSAAVDALEPPSSVAARDVARLRAGLVGSGSRIDGDIALLQFVHAPQQLIPVVLYCSRDRTGAYLRTGVRHLPAAAHELNAIEPSFRRSSALLTALALAGPEGIALPLLFDRVYGFPFDESRYGSTFRVALHRVRRLLPASASIAMKSEQLTLHVEEDLLIPDASSTPSTEERVALALAEKSVTSARAVASRLDISKRSAQRALRALAEHRICRVEGSGSTREYVVEDSALEAMTRTRHQADELIAAWGPKA